MGVWLTVAEIAIVANLLLLTGLGYVWGGNYRTFGSKHALGLLVFAVVLFLENALALYIFRVHPITNVWMSSAAEVAQVGMMSLRVFETVAIGFLAWITWD